MQKHFHTKPERCASGAAHVSQSSNFFLRNRRKTLPNSRMRPAKQLDWSFMQRRPLQRRAFVAKPRETNTSTIARAPSASCARLAPGGAGGGPPNCSSCVRVSV